MAENKTKEEVQGVEDFLNGLKDERKKKDSFVLLKMFKDAMKMEPKLWTGGMVGFGERHYQYESGHGGVIFQAGFAPRSAALTLYNCSGIINESGLLDKLGKYTVSKGCLYIKKLDDVNLDVLKEIVQMLAKNSKIKG